MVRGVLPDLGPRFERLTELPEWGQFGNGGVTMFKAEAVCGGTVHFNNMLRDYPGSQLKSAFQAFS